MDDAARKSLKATPDSADEQPVHPAGKTIPEGYYGVKVRTPAHSNHTV